eukprot:TRINITY_DN5459_c0_g1_i2.p1 TRINITY_DN5459_c0_g1~~TRINITY_DN5459_c0_g1_i2.p1  ORF type:complete len:604 (+),score=182.04 TRINITY_DN5459_c0_g1_i2:60-1814(+)
MECSGCGVFTTQLICSNCLQTPVYELTSLRQHVEKIRARVDSRAQEKQGAGAEKAMYWGLLDRVSRLRARVERMRVSNVEGWKKVRSDREDVLNRRKELVLSLQKLKKEKLLFLSELERRVRKGFLLNRRSSQDGTAMASEEEGYGRGRDAMIEQEITGPRNVITIGGSPVLVFESFIPSHAALTESLSIPSHSSSIASIASTRVLPARGTNPSHVMSRLNEARRRMFDAIARLDYLRQGAGHDIVVFNTQPVSMFNLTVAQQIAVLDLILLYIEAFARTFGVILPFPIANHPSTGPCITRGETRYPIYGNHASSSVMGHVLELLNADVCQILSHGHIQPVLADHPAHGSQKVIVQYTFLQLVVNFEWLLEHEKEFCANLEKMDDYGLGVILHHVHHHRRRSKVEKDSKILVGKLKMSIGKKRDRFVRDFVNEKRAERVSELEGKPSSQRNEFSMMMHADVVEAPEIMAASSMVSTLTDAMRMKRMIIHGMESSAVLHPSRKEMGARVMPSSPVADMAQSIYFRRVNPSDRHEEESHPEHLRSKKDDSTEEDGDDGDDDDDDDDAEEFKDVVSAASSFSSPSPT